MQGVSGNDAEGKQSPSANVESGSAERSPSSLWGRVTAPAREFHSQLARDQAFADHVGRSLDMWTAGICFLLYTIAAVLIFVINEGLYNSIL